MGVMLLAYALAYTIFNVPYLAMPAEMTKSYHERSHLMSYRVYAVGGAQMLTSYLGPMIIARSGGGAAGHTIMALALAPIIIASALACYLMTARASFTERPEKARYPLGVQIRSAIANAPFFILILTKFLTLMTLGVQAVFPFFFKRVLGVSDAYLGTYFLLSSIMLIVSQPLWLWLGRRLGKRVTYMIALGIAVPVSLSWLLAGHGESILLVYLRGALTGLGGGGAILMGQSMLPDTMDYDYRRTGLRREGVFAGFYTTVEKLAGAVGIAVVGAFLSASGYVQSRGGAVEQPASAIQAIYIAISCLPALISALGVVALIFYDLSEHKLHATGRLKSHPDEGRPRRRPGAKVMLKPRHWSATLILIMGCMAIPAAAGAAPALQASRTVSQRCVDLMAKDFSQVPDSPTQVTKATFIPATAKRVAYCAVEGYVTPTVGFGLWLPADNWNGKYIVRGCLLRAVVNEMSCQLPQPLATPV